MVELKFTNSDARPRVVTIKTRKIDAAFVMAWYGAFHAGDRYAVHIDGEKVEKGPNGEMIAQDGDD